MLIFNTNFRPIKGTKGYYRANVRHGVSEVHGGSRHTLGIIFHDGISENYDSTLGANPSGVTTKN